jgi:PAS domain-containing protein
MRGFPENAEARPRKVPLGAPVQVSNPQDVDRRGPNRPANGDLGACASCGGPMRFKERYVVTRMHVTVAHPAWVCCCGEETYVRPIVHVSRHRAPVERRLITHVGASLEDVITMRHALAYIREQTSQGSAMAMRDLVRVAISQLHRCPLIILAADDNGRYIAANDAMCTLTGYSQDELLDMHIWDLSITRNVERDRRTWRHFLREGGFVGEYHLRRKADTPIKVPCIAVAHIIPGLHVATMASRRGSRVALRPTSIGMLG